MAMDWSMFSTPSSVRSPVLGGVTARRTGLLLPLSVPNRMFFGFSFIRGCLPFFSLLKSCLYRCPGRHSMTAVSSGVASMRTGKRLPLASNRPSPLGQDRSHR